jgi:hypothetical protein
MALAVMVLLMLKVLSDCTVLPWYTACASSHASDKQHCSRCRWDAKNKYYDVMEISGRKCS